MASTYPLEILRHSASHIMADAVLRLFPEAKLGMGPAIENGFYYDFDLPHSLTPEDLSKIETTMQEIIRQDLPFQKITLSQKEAIARINQQNQPYKAEIIQDRSSESEFTFFQHGSFSDLCKGPHVKSTKDIKAFKLLKVSGAYWKGSEKNKMLQRIYGTAWNTQEELQTYLDLLQEAEKRDHRILGKSLDLFSISPEIGPGLILWHPKGAMIRHLIEDLWKKQHFQNGYELLYTPHIGKANLWQTSGHLDFYQENMYAPMQIEGEPYYLKPMNCPFHILIYKRKLHSYRDLPIRLAELGTVYRYERSGVLHGLMRVRGFTQDDAHIICTPEQMPLEIDNVLLFSINLIQKFGFKDYKIYLATRPEEKYVGDISRWEEAEKALLSTIKKHNIEYEIDQGGGAFYGPKIDIKIKDALNREWQCTTIQFDFNEPERFEMNYIGSDGQKHRPYMIHRALLGSIERFLGILIEHYAGKFPLWLSPIQIKILSINDQILDYAKNISQKLHQAGFRIESDFSSEKIGYKIHQAIAEKVPYMLIIGKKEAQTNQITFRKREDQTQGTVDLTEFIDTIKNESII